MRAGAGPLAGWSVLNTRPRESASALDQRLSALGARVVSVPAIGIGPPLDPGPFLRAMADWECYDWLVVTSARGAEAVVPWLTGKDLARLKIAALGESSSRPFTDAFLPLRFVLLDPKPDAGKLGAALGAELRGGERLLLIQGELANDELQRCLESYRVQVDSVKAYGTLECPEPEALREALELGVDAIVFCSPSAVRGCQRALGSKALRDKASGARLISIGPRTSAELRGHGFEQLFEAGRHDLDGLVEALLEAFQDGEAKRR